MPVRILQIIQSFPEVKSECNHLLEILHAPMGEHARRELQRKLMPFHDCVQPT